MVFVDLVTNGVSKAPITTVHTERKIRIPAQRIITETTPLDKRAKVAAL